LDLGIKHVTSHLIGSIFNKTHYLMGEDLGQAIVCDNGTGVVKAGFGGDQVPRTYRFHSSFL
jgi:hypothetical protein